MNHLVMDEKRPLVAANITSTGHLICKCGRFAIYLTNDGSFKVVDSDSGIVIEHMSAADAHDLSDASKVVEEWSCYHHVIKK